LIPNYLKDAKCALIIFDVASRSSLNNAELWLKLFYDNRTSEDYAFAFLIGNKIDLEYREVEKE
jgi:GTPase SAR1 family protein